MFVTLGVVTLPFQEVVGTDVLQVQEVGICKVYENDSHYQGYLFSFCAIAISTHHCRISRNISIFRFFRL